MTLPKITKTGNNTSTAQIGPVTLYYSYSTVIAFRVNGELTVSENVWSVTTAKHLTQLDGGNKVGRIPHTEFLKRLAALDL